MPLKITVGLFQIFRKLAEIFASQGAPPVAILPPVSTTPVANFATGKLVLLIQVLTTPVARVLRFRLYIFFASKRKKSPIFRLVSL
jgi:hypothetical protein